MIASHLPGRTDNEIKNHWNSRLSRQSYRFYTNKNKTTTSIDIANLVNQKKQRVGRVSRTVAKRHNQDRFFKNNKSSSLSTTNKSSPPTGMDKQVDENVEDCSNFVTKYMDDDQVHNNVIIDELRSNWLGFPDDALSSIDNFLQGETIYSSGGSNIHVEDQIEQWLAEIEVENLKKNEKSVDKREDESLSLNSLKTMGPY